MNRLPVEIVEYIGKFLNISENNQKMINLLGKLIINKYTIMNRLPVEIVEYIGKFLDVYDLHNFKSTCKRFNYSLHRLFLLIIEDIPWRIVYHAIDKYDCISIENIWITIGNFKKYKTLHSDNFYIGYFLDYENCNDCDDMKINGRCRLHGFDNISKSKINTFVKEGIGGDIILTIFELLKGESVTVETSNYICVTFTEKSFFDGLIDDPSISDSSENLEIPFPLFITKPIKTKFDKVEINKFPILKYEEKEGYMNMGCYNTICGIFSKEIPINIEELGDLGDYDFLKYNISDESSEYYDDIEEDYDY